MHNQSRVRRTARWLGALLFGLSMANAQAVIIIPSALNGNVFTQRLSGVTNDIAFAIGFNAATSVWLDVLLEDDDDPFSRISMHAVFGNFTDLGWADFSISLGGATWSAIGDVPASVTVDAEVGGRTAALNFDPSFGPDASILIGGDRLWFLNAGGGRSFSMHLAPLTLVPEPATSLLFLLALVGLVRVRVAVPIPATPSQRARSG